MKLGTFIATGDDIMMNFDIVHCSGMLPLKIIFIMVTKFF